MGYLNNDWGAKPGLVASERATVVTIREGTVDNKPPQLLQFQTIPPALYNSKSNESRDNSHPYSSTLPQTHVQSNSEVNNILAATNIWSTKTAENCMLLM